MRAFIIYTIIAIIAISMQSTVFPGIKPDLILILVCFYSLKYGEINGMLFGAIAGMLIDSAGGFIIGPNMLSKSITGFLFGLIRQKFFFWNVLLNTVLIAIFSIIDTFIVRISLEAFLGMSFSSRASGITLMVILYTIGAGLISYPILKPQGS